LACHLAAAQSLTVAAASDLQTVLPAIASQFDQETGQHVRLTFGSSGNFCTQIGNGAPFDDVGVVALSVALSTTLKSSGTYVEISESWYPPIEHAAVVLASSRQKPSHDNWSIT
jgi:ABC-type molybdate transport system substrate-binding protein